MVALQMFELVLTGFGVGCLFGILIVLLRIRDDLIEWRGDE
jgi:hypothetical protein